MYYKAMLSRIYKGLLNRNLEKKNRPVKKVDKRFKWAIYRKIINIHAKYVQATSNQGNALWN